MICKAWISTYGRWEKVDVASYAGIGCRGVGEWWVARDGRWSKESELYEDTPENAAIVCEIQGALLDIARLTEMKAQMATKMTKLKPKDLEE